MSMTFDEMKLAVCEKLPELIAIREFDSGKQFAWIDKTEDWNDYRRVNWPTEGLQVCHEAEKMLAKNAKQLCEYVEQLRLKCCEDADEPPNKDGLTLWDMLHATYEQRLEALCRVWWPEKFN